MAEEDNEQKNEDLDLNVDGSKKKGAGLLAGPMKYVLIGLLGLALVGLGAGVSYMLFAGANQLEAPGNNAEADQEQQPEVPDPLQAETTGPALYVNFVPPFMVHIKDTTGYVNYLQLEITVVMRDKRVQKIVRDHNALIKNNVLRLLEQKSYRELRPMEAREKLRRQILEEVRLVVKEQGNMDGVEDVLVTNFVMQ